MKDGLYRVTRSSLCAGFVVRGGRVVRSAPVLHKNIHYWMKEAVYMGPILVLAILLCSCTGPQMAGTNDGSGRRVITCKDGERITVQQVDERTIVVGCA